MGESSATSQYLHVVLDTILELFSPLDVFYDLVGKNASFLDLLCTFLPIASILHLSFQLDFQDLV